MTPIPTLHLRFFEKDVIVSRDEFSILSRRQPVLQQFWVVDNGKDVVGDMFKLLSGEWRDVPLEKEE